MATFRSIRVALCFVLATNTAPAFAKQFELSLVDAEAQAVAASWSLMAAKSDVSSAAHLEGAAYTALLPKLSFRGTYTYLSTLGELQLPQSASLEFGSHNNYSIGPQLNFTVWDSFGSLKAYHAVTKIRESRNQDLAAVKRQIILAVRMAYVRVQLILEEIKLFKSSLELAKKQDDEIHRRFKAGSTTKLDSIVSKRHVLSSQLRFKQKLGELSVAVKELLSLIGNKNAVDPQETVFKFDELSRSIQYFAALRVESPGQDVPQIKKLELLAQSADLEAASHTAKLYPRLDLSVSTSLAYPNGPVKETISQNNVSLMLSVPLYLGDPTWRLAEQKRSEAQSMRFRMRQLNEDLQRDYDKIDIMLQNLREQRKLANDDAIQSAELASLFYSSYREGRNTVVDVQAANNALLSAQINVARIDAQILTQMISLMAISGKEADHD